MRALVEKNKSRIRLDTLNATVNSDVDQTSDVNEKFKSYECDDLKSQKTTSDSLKMTPLKMTSLRMTPSRNDVNYYSSSSNLSPQNGEAVMITVQPTFGNNLSLTRSPQVPQQVSTSPKNSNHNSPVPSLKFASSNEFLVKISTEDLYDTVNNYFDRVMNPVKIELHAATGK